MESIKNQQSNDFNEQLKYWQDKVNFNEKWQNEHGYSLKNIRELNHAKWKVQQLKQRIRGVPKDIGQTYSIPQKYYK